jgi:hypothetical protein
LEDGIRKFIGRYGLKFAKVSSAVTFVDGEDKRHLLLDAVGTYAAKEERKYDKDGSQEFWLGLAKDYGLTAVLGDWQMRNFRTNEPIRFADSELLGKLREEDYLFSFAKEHQMTNSQFLRFRTLAMSANNAGISTNYETLAQKVTL